jgi:uncharacterized membrane protein (UPF0127 family)
MTEPGVVMREPVSCGYVLNRTRRQFLATRLTIADGHWTRLRGLIGLGRESFSSGHALWILPCRGVHTLGMRFPIDVVYLDRDQVVVHLEANLPPWRFAPVRLKAASVLELPENTLRLTGTTIGDELEIDAPTSGNPGPHA